MAEFVSAAAVSQRFCVSPTPSPRRQPYCHCLFPQANLPAHHLLWDRLGNRPGSTQGSGSRALEPARWREQRCRERCPDRESRAAAAAAERAPAATPVTQPPPLCARPFCSAALTREGRECTAPAWALPQVQGSAGPCDTSLRERALFLWLDSHGKPMLCWEYRLCWPGKNSLWEQLKNLSPGASAWNTHPLLKLFLNKEVLERDCDRVKNWLRGENRRLLLNGLFSNRQCIHRYPRVNREMMAKNQGQAQEHPRPGFPH